MEFGVLGRLEICDAERWVELASPKQRSLLALLLIDRGAVVSTDRIVEELWGSGTVADHQNAVWVQVSHLRSALEPDREPRSEGSFVLTRPPGYVLDVAAGDVDAGRFERLVDEGRALVARDPAAASIVLGEALALWRGHAYEEFTYESFAQQEIARLDERRLEAVEARIDADLGRGLSGELVSELLTLTRQHPLRERFTGQLMLAEYRSGRRSEALRAYRELKTRLAQEIGLSPSTELLELEERIVRDDPALTAPSPSGGEVGRAGAGPAVRGYELRREIARDELSVVHAAYQPDVGREVAITTVSSEVADDPDFIRRFEGDARVAAALEHPNIVPLYDYWREPGAAYLVTRLPPGGSLRDVLETRALTAGETVQMVDDVAGALDAAHARGVVHGHIDDDVILLDDDGRAYLTGFAAGRASTTTRPVGDRCAAGDIAALGLVAAHALTGLSGPLAAIEGALPRPVADVLCRAAEVGWAARLAGELATALDGGAGPGEGRVVHERPLENPYRGLSPFTRADAAVFFGRERVVERLVGRLAAPGVDGRCVAVVGPSGSGKSSVVLAGLLPALEAGALPGSSDWFVTTMTPGAHPFEALEAALLRVAVAPPPTLFEQLTGGDHGLRRAVRRILPDDDAELLLVIDQFEEAFTLADPAEAESFLDAIVAAAGDGDNRIRVVLTLRADFFDRPLRHRAFGELVRSSTEVITPMSVDELGEAITEPARPVGVDYSAGLVAEMITEVEGRPGALPLLQYTLTELFDGRCGNVIDRDDYRVIGGVAGAIATRAESLFAEGDPHEQEAAREIFRRLVTLGEGVDDTRRRVAVSELDDLPFHGRAVDAVLDRFTTHRLLTADRDPVTRSPTVEISHEALLTEWDRLRTWIDTAREDLRFQRRLRQAMSEWVEAGRSEDQLLTGGLLARLQTWAGESDVRLGESERDYLELSVAAHDRQARQATEREAERRAAEVRARRRLGYSVAAALVAIVVGALAVVALGQRRSAERSEDTIAATLQSQDLAAASAVHLRSDPDLATRLALASAAATAELGFVTPEALDALHWAIQEANIVYPADETTPVAVRPGPRGATGVFALPPDDVIELARSTDLGEFTPVECAEHFPGDDCPDPMRAIPTGLEVQGGDVAYGVVAPTTPGALDGTQVELIDPILDDVGFGNEIARFEDETGIIVARPMAVQAMPELIRRGEQQQPLPDVVFWSSPGALAELEPGSMIDLSAYLDMNQLRDDLSPTLLALGTVGEDGSWPSSEGVLIGLPADLDIKGLVYYPKDDFDAAGYEIPETYDELLALSEQIVADGHTPWCFDFFSGPGSGWPGTDLIETLVLREGGAELYDSWARHDIPFDAPEIRAAAARAETLLLSDGFVFGGSDTISEQEVLDGVKWLATAEPGCWLYHQGDFALGALPASAQPGVDVDVFPFPPLEQGDALPLPGGGTMFSIHADRPETRVFVRYVAGPTWGEEWAAPPFSQFLSPNARFDVAAYGRDADANIAAVQRALGEITRAAIADGTFRFDASDLMPGRIGSFDTELAGSDVFGSRGEFFRGMIDVVDGVRTMDEVLTDIEIAWLEYEAEQST